MQKKQRYGLIAGALLFVVGLYFLPRVVVDNEASEEELNAATVTAEGMEEEVGQSPEPANPEHEAHQTALPPQLKQQVDRWRSAFKTTRNSAEKQEMLDSLTAIWKGIQRWDSIAVYTEILWKESGDPRLRRKAGDAYYEAMTRAGSQQESARLAQKARNYLEERLRNSPADLNVKTKLGMTYVPTQNPMQGITMIREVLEEDPEHPLALLNLGLLSMRSGQFDKAVERFRKLTAVSPEDAQAHFYLGVAYTESGVPERARPAFTSARDLAGTDSLLMEAAQNYLDNLP